MGDCVKRGEAALEQQKFDEAVKEFTTAIANFPRSVDYYLKRSSAYSRSSPPNYDAAIKDVNQAVRLAIDRAKRELIGQAQLRRAILLFNMGQYADAEFILGFVKKYDEKNKTLPIWKAKIDTKLKALPEDDEKRVVKVKEIPEEEKVVEKEKTPAPVAAPKAPVQTPPSQIKHEFYQNRENVTLTLLAKGVPQDKTEIEIEENSISISFPTLAGTDYHFSLDPLYAPIDPSASTSKITPTKVELVLKKKTAGQQWKSLEGSGAPTAANITSSDPVVKQAVLADKPPEYPTSSRKGPKNWDKVVDDITKKAKKSDDAPAAEEDDDLEDHGGDEANYFFKKLFAGASPETQRAMMKSYQESNGTVLSTNWDEVSKGKVETSPPDGMIAKKWGQ